VPTLTPVGAVVPDFELVDQAGAAVRLSALKGKVVAVTFIYTRCPLPDYCPRMVENFRAVRSRLAARMDRDLVLLTISFDPQYDTPQMLTRYAASNRAGGPGWHFLTGEPAKIARVCDAFGIQYFAEEGLITHSLQTAVIDREGRLAATVEGKEFTPQQLGDLIEDVLTRP
jgi:protein SCO1/2